MLSLGIIDLSPSLINFSYFSSDIFFSNQKNFPLSSFFLISVKFFSGKINLKFIINFFLSITWEGLIPILIELTVLTTYFPFLSIISALNNFFEIVTFLISSIELLFLDPKCIKWIEKISDIKKKIKKINEILLKSIIKFELLFWYWNWNSASSISNFFF